jgi:hypothetical protein
MVDTLEVGTLLNVSDIVKVSAHVDCRILVEKLLLNLDRCDLLRVRVDPWGEGALLHVYLQLCLLHVVQFLLLL